MLAGKESMLRTGNYKPNQNKLVEVLEFFLSSKSWKVCVPIMYPFEANIQQTVSTNNPEDRINSKHDYQKMTKWPKNQKTN